MFGLKKVTWILVADGSKARIYASDANKHNLRLMHNLEFPASRMHDADLGSHKPHGIFERNKPESKVHLHHKEEAHFANQLTELLDNGAYKKEFHRLVLIASPKFLGLLRELLSKHVSELIVKEIPKDLTQTNETELKDYIWN